ncbi:hypothetical protein AM500_04010 [Bacillus sp. FJAT-18017]|nr:hypothetical protein AM500_04010 [Bacillus sp. FJAT-18017]
MPLGMVGVAFYLLHTILGNLLWPEYNPITTDISSLTADGAPDAELLRIFGMVYGICMMLMASALIFKAFREYHGLLKAGYIILLIMQVVSFIGYRLFPLTGDKTDMSFQNVMHLVVTLIVVFTTIAASFCLALGFLKQEKMVRLGKLSLSFAILITLFGVLNPISMNLGLDILGLTERLVIYTIQAFMFFLSFYYTFLEKNAVQD